MAQFVLDAMGQGRTLGEIARALSVAFAERRFREQEALSYVAALARQYT